jgi:hypothetical protein
MSHSEFSCHRAIPTKTPNKVRLNKILYDPSFCIETEFLTAFRALNPLKIDPVEQIRRDRESALRANLVLRRPHFSRLILRDPPISNLFPLSQSLQFV